jgi:hypothetical protein
MNNEKESYLSLFVAFLHSVSSRLAWFQLQTTDKDLVCCRMELRFSQTWHNFFFFYVSD